MATDQRKITLFTPDKIYSGLIDVADKSLRTIDIFNSANVYWKNPAEKGFDDALLLHQATVVLEGNTRLGDFGKLQLKLSDIILFYDTLQQSGNEREKLRAATLKKKLNEETEFVHIITHTRGDAFFYITGVFYGLFKSKSKHRYIPITETTVTEVVRHADGWKKKKVALESTFVGVSTEHIEACTFSEKKLKEKIKTA